MTFGRILHFNCFRTNFEAIIVHVCVFFFILRKRGQALKRQNLLYAAPDLTTAGVLNLAK